jgi:hypothetical protein
MAEDPHQWHAYACLQAKLAATSSITYGQALEEALNVIHQPGFRPDALLEPSVLRLAANAARQERRRVVLRRQAQALALDEASAVLQNDGGEVSTGTSSLDDVIHAQCELQRISKCISHDDWDLLTDVAAGIDYGDLAAKNSSAPAALRARVCRLRQAIACAA